MKKTIVQIKDIQWYEENKDEHGIVYFDKEKDNTNFFSRGMSKYCGMITEITHEDSTGNLRILADQGEWLWEKWQFSSMEEKEVNDENIIDAEYKEDNEIIFNDKEIHEFSERTVTKPLQIEDKRNTVEFKADIINDINSWGLSFNMGTAIINLITANKNQINNYKNQIEISLLCLQNELKELEKEEI